MHPSILKRRVARVVPAVAVAVFLPLMAAGPASADDKPALQPCYPSQAGNWCAALVYACDKRGGGMQTNPDGSQSCVDYRAGRHGGEPQLHGTRGRTPRDPD